MELPLQEKKCLFFRELNWCIESTSFWKNICTIVSYNFSLEKHLDERIVLRIKTAIPIVALPYKRVASNFISIWNDVGYSVVEVTFSLLDLKQQ